MSALGELVVHSAERDACFVTNPDGLNSQGLTCARRAAGLCPRSLEKPVSGLFDMAGISNLGHQFNEVSTLAQK